MINHTFTLRHIVTYETLVTVQQEPDANKAQRAAEQHAFTNPEQGKLIERTIRVVETKTEVVPDPAPPTTPTKG